MSYQCGTGPLLESALGIKAALDRATRDLLSAEGHLQRLTEVGP